MLFPWWVIAQQSSSLQHGADSPSCDLPSAAFQYAPGCQPWNWVMHLHSEYSCLKAHVMACVLLNRSEDA